MRGLLQKLWFRHPIRHQILVAFAAMNVAAMTVAAVLSLINVRNATAIEIDASLEIAKQFVRATVQSMGPIERSGDTAKAVEMLSRKLRVANIRHVRISVGNDKGELVPVDVPRKKEAGDIPPPAPGWFSALVEPPKQIKELSVLLSAPDQQSTLIVEQQPASFPSLATAGTVLISGEPADEIAEAWHDLRIVALVWMGLNAVVLVVLYLILKRMLEPIQTVTRGLVQLQDGDYATRLQTPKVEEFGTIADRFNLLAATLAQSRAENARLCARLISVQEDERREISKELHDEASPCLFGITANALSVSTLLSKRTDRKTQEANRHVREILWITDHLNLLNRALLKKLRPMALGRVALADVLGELMRDLGRRHASLDIRHSIKTTRKSFGEDVDLTIYRSIQESITNSIRHGKATAVRVELSENHIPGGHAELRLVIEDDGEGIGLKVKPGFGITGIRERVEALGGTCWIAGVPGLGTRVTIALPILDKALRLGREVARVG